MKMLGSVKCENAGRRSMDGIFEPLKEKSIAFGAAKRLHFEIYPNHQLAQKQHHRSKFCLLKWLSRLHG